jgi:FMN phosphatase YigB (HAD superfamily)
MAAADSKRIVLFDVDGTLTAARKVRSQAEVDRPVIT